MKPLTTTHAHIARPMPLILAALLMAAGGVYAQEDTQKARPRGESSIQKADARESLEKLLQRAGELIKGGKPGQAYSMLEPLEFEYSGEERFDFLIGVAALDSGRPDKATLAFERLLMVNPNSAAARLDMARAYFQLGDLQRAKSQFETVLKLNPSAAAQDVIQKYLDAIAAQESGKKLFLTGYVEAMYGRDSNINNATSQSQIFVDVIAANTTLAPGNVKTADNYYGVAAGSEIAYRLNARWGWYAGADLRQRGHSEYQSFDTQYLDARAGVTFNSTADRLRAGILSGRYDLGGTHHSDGSGLKGEWLHVFSPANQLSGFIQHAKYRFADAIMQTNDYNQQLMGIGWLHIFADGITTLSGGYYYGNEQDISPIITSTTPDGGRIDGGKRFSGMRIGGQTGIGDRTTLFISAGGQYADYSRINPLFLRQRSDRLYDVALGASWRFDNRWSTRAQLNYTVNDANIEIYGYDRTDVSLTIRRDFR